MIYEIVVSFWVDHEVDAEVMKVNIEDLVNRDAELEDIGMEVLG